VRIERQNPNPKLPMVRYVGGTWRVGGLLALSRAFGDSYLKGSLQFEGIAAGGDGYSSGFGLIAEPFIELTSLTPADTHVVLARCEPPPTAHGCLLALHARLCARLNLAHAWC
jgi:protein phosphatase 1L